ncbi:hypothetical protein, partial [Endozoicomonas atrinae]|uniref:hypothetical protein n=1 Tax=Endozoicomonas atrinae TaxID=1333660 RepID=UPI000A9A2B5E
GWLAPKEQIKIDFFRNLRQWRWVEKNIPSLKTLASKNIKEWYKLWKSNAPYVNVTNAEFTNIKKMEAAINENTTCTGRSKTFETLLGAGGQREQWTNQPGDGIPDVGRLLQGLPAYRKVTSGISQKGKPLFIITDGCIDIRNQTEDIQDRFVHYLHSVTKAMQAKVDVGLARKGRYSYPTLSVIRVFGSIEFKNLLLNCDKLFALSQSDEIDRQKRDVGMLEDSRIKEMMDDEDLVVIRSEEFQKIYDEYIESVE